MPTKPKSAPISPQLLFVLSILSGTLGWEVIVSLLAIFGLSLELSTGPVGFDVRVISFYMEVNPGTFIGLFFGYRAGQAVSGGASRRRRAGASRQSTGGRSTPRSGGSGGSGGTGSAGGPKGGSRNASGGEGSSGG